MAVDTPARVAILGAGPIGLEAALYARFLGYSVDLYEQGHVAENVSRWGHVQMFSPVAMNCSSLGLAALAAHDENYQPPDGNALLTGREWLDQYLLPLSRTDLLVDHIHEQTTVVAVGRETLRKGELLGDERRGDYSFRILLRTAVGEERLAQADVVIDTTGVYGHANALGGAGVLAIGEAACRSRIEWGVPNVLGTERTKYAGRHTLVIGSGHSAATSIAALAQLIRDEPATRVTWLTRHSRDLPLTEIEHDPLPARAELVRRANVCATNESSGVVHYKGTEVRAIRCSDNLAATSSWIVELEGEYSGDLECDEVIANVGYRPDNRIYSELHVHECYASGGPMRLAAALAKQPSVDCLQQVEGGPATLVTPEPHFYILGAKSYGRNSNFLFQTGLKQIRDLFKIIGDRETLDLYAGPVRLPR